MESRIAKAQKYLALGIILYPVCYSLLNFTLPVLMSVIGDQEHVIVMAFEVLTWFILPIFSVFYLMAFHQLAVLLKRWQMFVGYTMVSLAIVIEVVMPFLERSMISSSASFIAHVSELAILSGCLLFTSRQMTSNRKNA
ncbi:hypothetical protein [Vibrio sp. CAU 1672]|uniref:hypothetical protein n=1 Tax=Vibrio sp. CAU 1672 TaxID=3032594 RepID=UPI0023DCB9C3|nr:hypothetical protein [Vibrio sp. CAU 1672]MDF2156205.1 hypothetical protein [Vibrio sp. CAU 1672]